MTITRRVFFSFNHWTWQDGEYHEHTANQRSLIHGLADKIKKLDYTIEAFSRMGISDSLTATTNWTFSDVERVMRACSGAVFIGMPRWICSTPAGIKRFSTEYSHYEGALAVTLDLPRLVLMEETLERRMIFDAKHHYIAWIPENANASWLESPKFQTLFEGWVQKLKERRDLFLGYCSSSAATAQQVKLFLHNVGASVLDWQTDFVAAGSILEQIQAAEQRCSGGIFLFTRDDRLAGRAKQAAPRDNVIFEAGYFAAAKGKQRVLIILEEGAKLPADLGGDIYAALKDRTDITPIKETIRKFLEERL